MNEAGVPETDLDLSAVDLGAMPRHVGIILDGNGRWAAQRGLERTAGHAAGEPAIFEAIEGARAIGLEWLSLYTFSTENWQRPGDEVQFLIFFNEDLLIRRRDELHEKNVRIRFIGDLFDSRVPEHNRRRMLDSMTRTEGNTGLNLVFAFNYGGRAELVRAVRRIAERAVAGELIPEDLDEAAVGAHLWAPDMPDPDLIVRTSGEQRISNFLLWGSAYAELLFVPTLWPDFTRQSLVDAVVEYQHRSRRFGATS